MSKKILLKLHRWLGIISGPIVFVVALTGAFYAFQEEIQDLTQPYRFVEPQKQAFLLPSVLVAKAKTLHPHKKVHAILYDEPGRTTKVIFYQYNAYYRVVFLNPYTGQILADTDQEAGFFPWILRGHFYLWLPQWLGQPLVAWGTIVFAIVVISGLFVWWGRGNLNPQKWRLKKTKNRKRRNYDWHTLCGFYVSAFALVFATTGLVWGFVWFQEAYFKVTSLGEKYHPYSEPLLSDSISKQKQFATLDSLFHIEKQHLRKGQWLEFHLPEQQNGTLAYNINLDRQTYGQIDYHYFDPIKHQNLSVQHHWGRSKEATFAQQLQRSNYDIHVGAVLGFWGKCLAFLASLCIASLPITGYLIWRARKK
ncbi:MAG: hypothetical protein RL751_6 [Bacteroidota bacterium]|jgi:uncharacterized iron-regulated membrane protein